MAKRKKKFSAANVTPLKSVVVRIKGRTEENGVFHEDDSHHLNELKSPRVKYGRIYCTRVLFDGSEDEVFVPKCDNDSAIIDYIDAAAQLGLVKLSSRSLWHYIADGSAGDFHGRIGRWLDKFMAGTISDRALDCMNQMYDLEGVK